MIWYPQQIQDIRDLESVQRYFVKKLCRRANLPNATYHERLHWLNIETLEYRRLKFDLIFLFKLLNSLIDLPFEPMFTFYSTPYQLRRHQHTLALNRHNSNIRKFFYTNRVIPIWNKLLESVNNRLQLCNFKRKLNTVDLLGHATRVLWCRWWH